MRGEEKNGRRRPKKVKKNTKKTRKKPRTPTPVLHCKLSIFGRLNPPGTPPGTPPEKLKFSRIFSRFFVQKSIVSSAKRVFFLDNFLSLFGHFLDIFFPDPGFFPEIFPAVFFFALVAGGSEKKGPNFPNFPGPCFFHTTSKRWFFFFFRKSFSKRSL